jgi:3-phenylpropionate/trans-cinnamate dioxygenase ferredoxin component
MGEFISVGPGGDLGEGDMTNFEVEGARIGVARVEGTLYAFSDVCTHQGCPLAEGELSGTELECECHGSVFQLTTGEVLEGPATRPIEIYPAREVDGQIQIEV